MATKENRKQFRFDDETIKKLRKLTEAIPKPRYPSYSMYKKANETEVVELAIELLYKKTFPGRDDLNYPHKQLSITD